MFKQSEAALKAEIKELKRTENTALQMKHDELVTARKEKSDVEKRLLDIVTKIGLNDQSMMNDEAKTYNTIVAYNAKLGIGANSKLESSAAAQRNKMQQYSFYKSNRKFVYLVCYISTQLNSLPPLSPIVANMPSMMNMNMNGMNGMMQGMNMPPGMQNGVTQQTGMMPNMMMPNMYNGMNGMMQGIILDYENSIYITTIILDYEITTLSI